ncbi:hypothetical protein FPOAC2_06127 [Fusarium poae]|uniref:hypothetical protein n=1 Tax=Fusarium poae TaxID=36050 RepID=UPI001CE75C69|nr:hypothetical protein FPOAC1_006010 [Fusarium poae]KAG8672724.1 hypothetical protein FPOAC1_006010 [Fusarium poae]
MQAVSQNLETFIAARAILGFCTSFLAQPSPILITELAYPTHRGKLTALEEARKILVTYHAVGDTDAPLVSFEMAEIERALTHEADAMSQNSWLELLRTTANRRRTLIAVIVGWFAQWNGVNLISYYLVLVLNTIGITNVKDQTLINGLLQISNWLAAIFVGAMLVDRLGRRTLFLVSICGILYSDF